MIKIILATLLITSTLFANTIEQLKTDKKLRIGIKYDTPPFGYLENKHIKGFDMELSKIIIEEIKKKLKLNKLNVFYKKVYPKDKEQKLIDKNIDMVIAAYTITDKRKKIVDFSIPYFSTNVAILYKGETVPNKIGHLKGSMVVKHLTSHTLVPYIGYKDMYNALQKGNISAVSTDQVILEEFRKKYNDFKISTISIKSDYAIGIRKNDKDFLKLLNEIIEKITKDGRLESLKKEIGI